MLPFARQLLALFGWPRTAPLTTDDGAEFPSSLAATVAARRAKARESDDPTSPASIARLIAAGQAPSGLVVAGSLAWPDEVRSVELPDNLSCHNLNLSGKSVSRLPRGLAVKFNLTLRGCVDLTELPSGLTTGSLDVSGCRSLATLPEDLAVYFLDISDCPQLRDWPARATLRVGRLRARNCTGLTQLAPWLKCIAQLDLSGCVNITSLPEDLEVTSWIDVGGSGLRALPAAMQGVALRWRGVPIDERTAFRPEEITAAEVLGESNAERRRVKLERMGYERFFGQAQAAVLDSDRDTGGERRLLRVELDGDEPLLCVAVFCPSTARQYLLRVPPDIKTCHQAIAWTAGFDDPAEYRPLAET